MAELDDIRAFVEVAETGGFSRAAQRLGVSKSIVSRRLARLETELGARLLSRTTRGVSPTEAGVEYKARAERILVDLDEAREAVAQRSGEVVGRLCLSVPLSFGTSHVAPVLAELAARHPKLTIEAAYSDRFVDLVAERFDAAIRLGTLRDSSLVARRIAAIRRRRGGQPGLSGAGRAPDGAGRPRPARLPRLHGRRRARALAVPRRAALDHGPARRALPGRQWRGPDARRRGRARHRRAADLPRRPRRSSAAPSSRCSWTTRCRRAASTWSARRAPRSRASCAP